MEHLRVIDTGDGSHSLLRTDLQETYHSVHGAVRESSHVFMDHGLRVRAGQLPGQDLSLLEIGLGTGLNTLLTAQEAQRLGIRVRYETWEKHPLPESIWRQLNHGDVLADPVLFHALHEAAWDQPVALAPGIELFKRRKDLLQDEMESTYDLIYYDAFAPSRQPEMWTREILAKVTRALKPGGLWVTYCAKGQVKRDLAALGLTVETLPGPPRKKEMTRATRH